MSMAAALGRDDAIAADRRHLRPGADPRHQRPAGAADRLDVAHGFTVLVMKRSILTEKVARRGYHISREYAVDPLERLSVGEVMTADVVTVPASMPLRELMTRYFFGTRPRRATGLSGRGPGRASCSA